MGSNKTGKDRDRKKRKRERSRSRDRHRRHRKQNREERSPSIDLSDLSVSDLELGSHNEEVFKESAKNKAERRALREHSPMEENTRTSGGSKEMSMSIEESNKIRAKLGLKPLVENAPMKSVDEMNSESDYKPGEEIHNPPQNISDKLQIEKLREKIAAHREKNKYHRKLKTVKCLGESDEEDSSALAWVSKSRKIAEDKKMSEKTNKMLAELDDQFGIGDLVDEEVKHKKKTMYGANSLSGLKVEHEHSRFEEGHTTILTLKDSNILDNDEDTLVNVNIVDVEKVERNLKNKKRKKDALEYDAPEMDEYGNLIQNEVLEKYDEEIAGDVKRRSFRIGEKGEAMKVVAEPRQINKMAKLREMASLEGRSAQLATEYLTPGEMVSFKKVKRKKKKRKMLTADDLEPLEDDSGNFGSRNTIAQEIVTQEDDKSLMQMVEDEEYIAPSVKMEVDEESNPDSKRDIELEEALSRSRRAKLEATDWSWESAAVQHAIKQECSHPVDNQELNVTMNITDEFCRTLGDIPTYGLSGNRAEEEGAILQAMSPTRDDDDKQGAWAEVHVDNTKVEISNDTVMPILEEEPSAGSGIAMALELAKKKGYLEKDDSKKAANAALQHLRAVHYSIEDKAVEDDRRAGGGRGDRYMGPITDFREKDGYRPDVKLEYVDDEGRKLCAKEAFRYLSHKFHGKGSGKNKLEKRMKKWKEDLNLKYMNSSDTPLQTLERQREKQKQLGTAYIVLSGTKTQESLSVQK